MRLLMPTMILAVAACAQNAAQPPAPQVTNITAPGDMSSQVPAPRADDVKTMDGLLAAIYDVISGPAGARDWDRFRSLFVPQARFTALNKAPDGQVSVTQVNVNGFVQMAGDAFKQQPFYENAMVNRVQSFGNVSQVFSSYESRHAKNGAPFERGINSIQLLNDGKRWWVVSILWDVERPDNPMPKDMAK